MTQILRIPVSAAELDALEQALWAAGAQAITLLDQSGQPVLEPAPGETPVWARLTVEALLPDSVRPDQIVLTLLSQVPGLDAADVELAPLPERDWTRAWMDRFQAMRFGRRLWVCPSHQTPDPDWPVVIHLDPGLAFGSGTHPTTALCLEWLDALDLTGQTVIDYGCGSGILAIAAAGLGARRVLAVDHDPQALEATRENARRNGVEDRIEVLAPEALGEDRADLIVANILAGALIDLADVLSSHLRHRGRLALSGILAGQADAVRDAYSPALRATARHDREDWVLLEFERDQ